MVSADLDGLSSLSQADQDAIGTTLIALVTGFRERDAEKLVGIYMPTQIGSMRSAPLKGVRDRALPERPVLQ